MKLTKTCGRSVSSWFVPKHKDPTAEDISRLSDFVHRSRRLLVVTGAGISTESGIPDYRSEEVGLYATSNRRPLDHKTFMTSPQARQRYWTRNFMGWERWSNVEPNISHKALAFWERNGLLKNGIVTQNVDQLHFKAGSEKVTELHGSNSIVDCMNCSYSVSRHSFQTLLQELNPNMKPDPILKDGIKPDGDVELSDEQTRYFKVPLCPRCGRDGILKPRVVFFGDNVPKRTIDLVHHSVKSSDAVLIIGSSLQVFSGYRIVLWAKDYGIRVAVLNIGKTRADSIIDLKVDAKAGDVLPLIQ